MLILTQYLSVLSVFASFAKKPTCGCPSFASFSWRDSLPLFNLTNLQCCVLRHSSKNQQVSSQQLHNNFEKAEMKSHKESLGLGLSFHLLLQLPLLKQKLFLHLGLSFLSGLHSRLPTVAVLYGVPFRLSSVSSLSPLSFLVQRLLLRLLLGLVVSSWLTSIAISFPHDVIALFLMANAFARSRSNFRLSLAAHWLMALEVMTSWISGGIWSNSLRSSGLIPNAFSSFCVIVLKSLISLLSGSLTDLWSLGITAKLAWIFTAASMADHLWPASLLPVLSRSGCFCHTSQQNFVFFLIPSKCSTNTNKGWYSFRSTMNSFIICLEMT